MPSRSTILQRVVFHVERQLAANATVEESVLLPERSSKNHREVDVVIRANIGEHSVVICVECQDRSRKATVEWVEQMAMKHSLLPTSKLILVAVQGFTGTAKDKAASFGIDTYSFDEALAADWIELLGKSMSFDMYAFRILKCGLVLAYNQATEMSVGRNFPLFNSDGTMHGTLGELVDKATGSVGFTEKALKFGAADIPTVIGVKLRFKMSLFAEDDVGKHHPVEHVRVYLEISSVPNPKPFTAARYRNSPVAFVHGQSPAGDFAMTLIKPVAGSPTGAFTLKNPDTGEVNTVGLHVGPKDSKVAFVTEFVRGKRK